MMQPISIPFDVNVAYEIACEERGAVEITLPEALDEFVWEKLQVIKELVYPLPLLVALSPSWKGEELENILVRLAVSFVSGVLLTNSFYLEQILEINTKHKLGLLVLFQE